jgi:predicted HicB family RNase H-like nuclease
MSDNMHYKGYTTKVEYSAADTCLIGRIIGIKDIVVFHGDSVPGFKAAFEEAVDDYLEYCAKKGKEPQKPYSGKITLKIPPEVHAKLAVKAEMSGTNINDFLLETLTNSINPGA